ncbi:hypothetical protein JQ604_11105 [Bradyrhizobium jicamae]|uniref:hypothetical protein n=1 Tax=Bradyrhizobium jicamae TaxID=280332 RepID=UPI001BA7261F|nr:hypothetical protein [Bradyrhizobium jicamae]MBR0752733.1 hypothetical protein [Bradyrhizobium jicamae]
MAHPPTEQKPLPEGPQQLAAAPQSTQRLLVPRRIDVFKDDKTPDIFLKMEVNDTLTVVVPIGPRLAAGLIEGIDRALRAVPPPSRVQ